MEDDLKNNNGADGDNAGSPSSQIGGGGEPLDSSRELGEVDEAKLLKEELEKLKKEKEEYLNGWQRAKADFINYRKEEASRLEEIVRYGNEEFLRELVSVLDNFDLALLAMKKDKEISKAGEGEAGVPTPQAVGMEKGIYLIRSRLFDVLRNHGLEKIQLKIGESFDPSVAEAISEIDSDLPSGAVVEEIEPGYKIFGKVLRPARVKISKGQNTT